jgi:hypothetical protein
MNWVVITMMYDYFIVGTAAIFIGFGLLSLVADSDLVGEILAFFDNDGE